MSTQSTTACCPRETIPDSCSCPDGCECLCLDCDCRNVAEVAGPHWMTRWDPNDGEPYGTVCHCDADEDHDGNGDPFPPRPLNGRGER